MITIEPLYIRMFGNFSLRSQHGYISSDNSRSKKVWLLLAYLLCKRGHPVSRNELIRLFWGNASNHNPENALKTTLHRARTLLNQLWPSAGYELIIWNNGNYSWNPDIPLSADVDEFVRLSQKDERDEPQWLQDVLDALSLYRGDFLSSLPTETWIIPLTAYYHNLYIQNVLDVVPFLFNQNRHQEAADICRKALSAEPYHEPLHCLFMQTLLALGDFNGAAAVYEEFRDRLFFDLGIKPGDEARAIYRAATTVSSQALSIDIVLEHLQETDAKAGALQCEFDYFKILCYAESRGMARTGKTTHISILTVSDSIRPLTRQNLDTAMERLGEQIRLTLRRGDAFSRCSASQFIILIPHANYENSCMISRKILNAFTRRYPNCPARIDFNVHPLASEPSGSQLL